MADTNRNYRRFTHMECEFFPCHPGADPEHFNCLFCYCPLYMLGEQCGGDFVMLPDGVKDCSGCLFPHQPENFDSVTARFRDICEKMKGK